MGEVASTTTSQIPTDAALRDQIIKMAVDHNSGKKLFLSNRQTDEATAQEERWIGEQIFSSIKYSLSPYNQALKLQYSESVKPSIYKNKVFGQKMLNSIRDVVDNDAVRQVARELQIPFPDFSAKIDDVIQGRQKKKVIPCFKNLLGMPLDEREQKSSDENCPEAFKQARAGLSDKNKHALTRMLKLSQEFDQMDIHSIKTLEQWRAFIDPKVNEGYIDNLDYTHFLHKVFDLDQELADELTWDWTVEKDETKEPPVETRTGEISETMPVKWLNKIISNGFGYEGCLTDVVNLVHAILSKDDEDAKKRKQKPKSEVTHDHVGHVGDENKEDDDIKFSKEALKQKIKEKVEETQKEADPVAPMVELKEIMQSSNPNLKDLWIPTHLVMDGEMDDVLCWALLETLHRMQKKDEDLKILVHLPEKDPKEESQERFVAPSVIKMYFDYERRKFHKRVDVFTDPASTNYEALNTAWKSLNRMRLGMARGVRARIARARDAKFRGQICQLISFDPFDNTWIVQFTESQSDFRQYRIPAPGLELANY